MNWIIFITISQYLTIVYCNFCSVDFIKNQELIYLKHDDLHYPEMVDNKIKFKWAVGDKGAIICDDKNYISAQDHDISKIEFECKKVNDKGKTNSKVEYKLRYKEKETEKDINPEKLKCNNKIKSIVLNTNQKCESGTLLKVGIQDNKLFIPFFYICYDYNTGSVRYSKHIIAGKAKQIIKREKESCNGRSSHFFKDELPYFTREGEPYEKINYVDRFSDIVESSSSSKKAFPKGSGSYFLARGHLTPVDDGIFNFWKRATMLYVNVAPEWQIINTSNWKRVENIARTMAIALNDNKNFEVITGIAGVLKMRNEETKKDEDIYMTTKKIQEDIIKRRKGTESTEQLPNKKQKTIIKEDTENLIPVPKYYWKVLKYHNQYIAFITLNNPYEKEDPKICNDICEKAGYPSVSERNIEKGFHNFGGGRTYCCTIEQLAEKFGEAVPSDFKKIKNANVLMYIGNSQILKTEEETEKTTCP